MFDYKKFESHARQVACGDERVYAAMVDAASFCNEEYGTICKCREFAATYGGFFSLMTSRSCGYAFVNGLPVAGIALKTVDDFYEIDTDGDGLSLDTYEAFTESLKGLSEVYDLDLYHVGEILNGNYPDWTVDVHVMLEDGTRIKDAVESYLCRRAS